MKTKMRHKYFFIIPMLLVLPGKVCSQNRGTTISLDTSVIPQDYPVVNPSTYTRSSEEENSQVEDSRLKNFRIDTINFATYKKWKSKFKSPLDEDSSKVSWTDTSFALKLGKTKEIFTCNKRDYSYCNYYLGYLAPLQLFAVYYVDGRNEVSTLILLDKSSGKMFYLPSPYDYALRSPSVSTDTSVLSAYTFDYYTNESFISLHKIMRKGSKYQLKALPGLDFANTEIKALTWISPSQFILCVKEPGGNENEGEKYYLKITVKKDKY